MTREQIKVLNALKNMHIEVLLEYLPEGIEHRADKYNTVESFECGGSYEEDARYVYPARDKLRYAVIEKLISEHAKNI